MTSYRRINSRTLNNAVQQQDNMVTFMNPISQATYPNYFSVPDASNTSLLVSNGSPYSASASNNLTFDGTTLNVIGKLDVSGNAHVSGVLDVSNNVNVTGSIANPTGILGSSIQIKNQIPNGFSGALIKNTYYLSPVDGLSITCTLPLNANSAVGDAIVVEYQYDISSSGIHKYGTSGQYFMLNSSCYKPMIGALAYAVSTSNGSTHDFLNLTGALNAGPGVGTNVVFTYNGAKWRAEALCTTSGTGGAAGTSAFATT
jgi:hypothetical protein